MYIDQRFYSCSVELRTAQSDPGPNTSSRKGKGKEVIRQDSPEHGIVLIAHDQNVQRMFDELRIPWGVQYEIARGITSGRWDWEEVTRDKLKCLRPRGAYQLIRKCQRG